MITFMKESLFKLGIIKKCPKCECWDNKEYDILVDYVPRCQVIRCSLCGQCRCCEHTNFPGGWSWVKISADEPLVKCEGIFYRESLVEDKEKNRIEEKGW